MRIDIARVAGGFDSEDALKGLARKKHAQKSPVRTLPDNSRLFLLDLSFVGFRNFATAWFEQDDCTNSGIGD